MPVALMFDGPSMGGFVCPATIASAQLWKMGQVAAKDEVHFRPMTLGAPRGRGAARTRAALRSTQRMPEGGLRSLIVAWPMSATSMCFMTTQSLVGCRGSLCRACADAAHCEDRGVLH
jgi:hypothetical protein